jgi:hypothetical protein
LDAIEAIGSHLERGDLSDGLVFDAVRLRLIEIGEAIKALEPELLAAEPEVSWADACRHARLARAPLFRYVSRHHRGDDHRGSAASRSCRTTPSTAD